MMAWKGWNMYCYPDIKYLSKREAPPYPPPPVLVLSFYTSNIIFEIIYCRSSISFLKIVKIGLFVSLFYKLLINRTLSSSVSELVFSVVRQLYMRWTLVAHGWLYVLHSASVTVLCHNKNFLSHLQTAWNIQKTEELPLQLSVITSNFDVWFLCTFQMVLRWLYRVLFQGTLCIRFRRLIFK
jgi:hypothetical protein